MIDLREEAQADLPALIIYQVVAPEDLPDLSQVINDLQTRVPLEIRKCDVPAVVGELAGAAIDILISNPVQAILNAAEVGTLIWVLIKKVKAGGRCLRINKALARILMIARATEDLRKDARRPEKLISRARVWGPMDAQSLGGMISECGGDTDDAYMPEAFLMAVVFPWPRKRARTYWYLMSAGGILCASWCTQTFVRRLPSFLKPRPKSS